ncbi:MAG: indole-3-glycerol phosphate synthase TrpC [Rhodobacterales bacterium CG15_BIG_FIL_POST_REV_8_21_14_020_59_13]|nr:MAG: indole-3-glycerol phosphate synthase TrpC [Rhodobacterales bacterium CG15_BIG_FIL_POST_REV_8_21_14_020_59_13]
MNALQKIEAYKREEIARGKAAFSEARLAEMMAAVGLARDFAGALSAKSGTDGVALIAEIKKASPSKGLIRAAFDPAALASAYESGGATCLSVLTDAPSFQGHADYLAEARAATPLPALRKDFLLDVWQVKQSRALGADAILVIMASVDDALALDLVQAAQEFGMAALIETHDAAELDRALALPSPLIGVNNRDLTTFETSLETFERLAADIPDDRFAIAESGIFTPADVARLKAAGAKGLLVGESLMRQADVAEATRALLA